MIEPAAVASEAARLRGEMLRAEGAGGAFAAAVQATPMPMVVTDPSLPDNPIVLANDAFLRLTGYTRAETLGRNCRFLQGPQTDPAAVARLHAALHAGQPSAIDLRNYRKDGTPFWNRLLIAPVRDDTGTITHFFSSQFDVTAEIERVANLEARNEALVATLAERLAALEDSETRFRHMADNAPVMVWTTNAAGRCTWLSRTWTAFTGQEQADGLGDGSLAVVHPEDRPAMVRAFDTANAAQLPYRAEFRLQRADGRYGWVIDTGAPRFGEDGSYRGYVGSVLDITDRREAEGLLELSEQSLRLATDAAEIGTWDLDVVSDVLDWSDRCKAMFGISPGVPPSMADFYAGLHPADYQATVAAFQSALDPARRSVYDVEYRTIGKEDGVVRWVAAKGKALFAEDGTCLRALGTVINITDRKAAQARQTVLLGLADPLRTLGDAGAIAAASTTMLQQYFDTPRVGLLTIGAAVPGAGPPIAALPSEVSARLSRGQAVVHEDMEAAGTFLDIDRLRGLLMVPLLRDGALAALLYVGQVTPHEWLAEDIGLVEEVAARTWDAMQRARAEAELRELNATLEARVEERTAALRQAEEALRQAQKMEAVGQLTGGIAHDFNNLLTGIVGALELLERRVATGRTEGLERYTGIALSSARRAGALTQRLLAFARRQPLDPRPTDANKLLAGMADLLQRTLGPAVALDMALPPGAQPTLCDANQLESAILNLAINARDAMPEGGRLTIATSVVHLDDDYARAQGGEVNPGEYTAICVADTGIGMAPEIIARVFEPFFTTKPLGQGTGLGLSMLYGFARQSNGHVRIASELGQGTTVHLYLPVHAGQAEEADGVAPALALPAAHATILVVDDESAIRLLVTETLTGLGYSVIEAVDGPSAVAALRSGAAIDFLLTDFGLPGLNGGQVAEVARAVHPGLPVLIITGYAHDLTLGRAALQGDIAMMTKPFAMDALADRIRTMLATQ